MKKSDIKEFDLHFSTTIDLVVSKSMPSDTLGVLMSMSDIAITTLNNTCGTAIRGRLNNIKLMLSGHYTVASLESDAELVDELKWLRDKLSKAVADGVAIDLDIRQSAIRQLGMSVVNTPTKEV